MKVSKPGPHIDQLLRHTRWHHSQLSSMADVKANLLMTASSLVLTLSFRYAAETPMKWVAATLVTSCIVTILLSAYAVMPKIGHPPGQNVRPDPADPGFNLLFFGDFTHLSYEQFEQEMEKILNDPDLNYEAQVREIYLLGIFLSRRKYRYIRWAYTTFLIGIVGSGIVFLVSELA